MKFSQMVNRIWESRKKYEKLEMKTCGRLWTKQEVFQGLVGDIGDLAKLVSVEAGTRGETGGDIKEKLTHELMDCFWSVIVLSKMYDIDIEKNFNVEIQKIDEQVEAKLGS